MASKKFDKDSEEFLLLTDYWKLIQYFWIPEEGKYWEQLISQSEKFCAKHNNSFFAERLADAFLKAKENEWRDAKKG